MLPVTGYSAVYTEEGKYFLPVIHLPAKIEEG